MAGNLKDKVALVTGASRGIGRAIAVRLGEDGALVIINYRNNVKAAEESAELVRQSGGKAAIYSADVADKAELLSMIDTIEDTYGPINVLVNNAGIIRDNFLVRMSDDELELVLRTNLHAPIWAMRRVIRSMTSEKWGRIINVSSVSAQAGNPMQVNYAAAKAGLLGATKALAREVAGKSVTVNAVAPGYVITEMTDGLPDRVKEVIRSMIPVKVFGRPEQIAHAVAFLANPKADYVTGAVIDVNGGMYMR